MKQHRVSMLGTGLIGDFYTMTLHGQRNRDRVQVVYSRSAERGDAFRERHGIPESTTDMMAAIEHPDTDVVVVALPNFLHEETVTAVAKAGKAVLVTKPLGRNAGEAKRMLDVVEKAGVFGGYLEDTFIGSVVLDADKRFKTVSCGLDPDSRYDIRDYTRNRVPAFLTEPERSFSRGDVATPTWEGTRYWYYPDSVEIDSDFDYRYAIIRTARFTADAERSRQDFSSDAAFQRLRAAKLDPSTRQNIEHLNRNYDAYAAAFPELRELTKVA